MSNLKETLREQADRVAEAAERKGMGVFRGAQASGSLVAADGRRLTYYIVVRAAS